LSLVMSQKNSACALAAVGKKPDAEKADGDRVTFGSVDTTFCV